MLLEPLRVHCDPDALLGCPALEAPATPWFPDVLRAYADAVGLYELCQHRQAALRACWCALDRHQVVIAEGCRQ